MDYINQITEAVKNNKIEDFKNILDKEDFDINQKYRGGKNLLHILIDGNIQTSYINAVIEKGIDIDSQWVMEETPLQRAVYSDKSNSNETVKLLLQNGANPNIIKDNKSILYSSIENGFGLKGQYLLNANASTNPIHNDKPLALLFLSNAILDNRYYQALDHLIKTKDLDINYKNNNGNSLLDTVIKEHTKNDLYYFLKKESVNINYINSKGQNALIAFVENRTKSEKFTHNEAKEYNIEIVDYLVDKKNININSVDNSGKNVFDYIPSQHAYLREYLENKLEVQNNKTFKNENNLHDLIKRRKPSL